MRILIILSSLIEKLHSHKMAVSLKVTIVVVVVVLLMLTVAGIWVPSAVLATNSLVDARRDQMKANTKTVGNRVLDYFQVASRMSNGIAAAWNFSAAANPAAPDEHFVENYAKGIWLQINRPQLSSLLLVRAHNVTTACWKAGVIMSSTYMVNIGPKYFYTPGANCSDTSPNPVPCQPDKLRINLVAGTKGTDNPLEIVKLLGYIPCPPLPNFYKGFHLTHGDPTIPDSGITVPAWKPPVIVGAPPHQVFYKQVHFPILADDKYPLSGAGMLGTRVGESSIGGAGQVTLQELLVGAAAITEIDDILFLVTAQGELAASSNPNQSVEVKTAGEAPSLVRLTRADNESMVLEPVLGISKQLIGRFCNGDTCELTGSADKVEAFGDYQVTYASIEDTYAIKLDLLLVMAVKQSDIVKPAKKLNTLIAIASCSVLVLFAALAVVLGFFIATPVIKFTEKIHLSSMMDLDGIDLKSNSSMSEIQWMNESLIVLVEHLVLYKSFLPSMLLEKDEEESSAEEASLSHINTGSRSGMTSHASSTVNTMTRRKVLPASAKRKIGAVLTTNIRKWSQGVLTKSPENLENSQMEFVSVLSHLSAGGGTLDYVNGDRCTISFLKSSKGGITAACRNSLRLRVDSASRIEGLVIGIAQGALIVGVMGVASYRSMQVCGFAVTAASRIVEYSSKREEKMLIVVDEATVTSYECWAVMTGLVRLRVGGIIGVMDLIKIAEESAEWLYDSQSKRETDAIAAYNELFKQFKLVSPDTDYDKFVEFKSATDDLLNLQIDIPCRDYIKRLISSTKEFTKAVLD